MDSYCWCTNSCTNSYGQFHHELQCHPAFESFIIPTLAGFCLSIWTPSMELPSVPDTYVRTCFSGLSIPFLTRRLLQFAPFKRFEEENSRFVGTCRRANISFKPSPFSNLKINLMIFHAGGYHRKDHQMKCFLCVPFCVFPPLKFKGSIISKDITGQQSSLQPGGGESHCWAQIRARWQASGRFRRGLLTGWMVEGFCMTWCFIQLGGCRVAVGDLPENHPLFFLVCWKSIWIKVFRFENAWKVGWTVFCYFSLVENLAPWVVATMLWKPFPGFGHTLYIHT